MNILNQMIDVVYIITLIVLGISTVACFIRTLLGPRISDRVVGVNMIGTRVIIMIAVLALLLDESVLIDVCLIYALLSFLAVVVLCKVYTADFKEHNGKKKKHEIKYEVQEEE